MLDERKSAILHKVVTEHIETGQPVGSAHVVRDPRIDVSPATVRSDMATLEREGYLVQPHTSAGRVPTDKGYRFFVDHLETTATLDPVREEQVQDFFANAHGELDRILRDTSRLLSELTDHAAVVVAPTHESLSIRSTLLTRLGPHTALLVVVLSNGVVEKHLVDVSEETTDDEIDLVSENVREQLVGQVLGQLSAQRAIGNPKIDEIIGACHLLLTNLNSLPLADEVYVGGTSRMAEQFSAIDTVREVLSILEQSFVVVTLLRDIMSQGLTVSIGAEHGLESLGECSLVVAPYGVGEEIVGTIGVLGPTRMNYPQALAAVAVVSQHLGSELSSR